MSLSRLLGFSRPGPWGRLARRRPGPRSRRAIAWWLLRVALVAAGPACADAGQAAIRHDGPIHLLVTDVVMPGTGGRELASRLVHSRPGLKVLFTSGYTEDEILRRGVVGQTHRLLEKPYRRSRWWRRCGGCWMGRGEGRWRRADGVRRPLDRRTETRAAPGSPGAARRS